MGISPNLREKYLFNPYKIIRKPLAMVLLALQAGLVCWLIAHFSDEPPGKYIYIIVILIVAPIVFAEVEWFAGVMHWRDGPIFDMSTRAAKLIAIGYGVAVAFAILLAFVEGSDRELSPAEVAAARAKDPMRKLMNDANLIDDGHAAGGKKSRN